MIYCQHQNHIHSLELGEDGSPSVYYHRARIKLKYSHNWEATVLRHPSGCGCAEIVEIHGEWWAWFQPPSYLCKGFNFTALNLAYP
ncbi:hypothetical protein TorRG33x02_346770 [Trema orientale]|uniref:Uncharacterized protein n=1 Tax=Trema orientale TaxID=63057 RepID=A0A2P5AMF3_TREOI|nr:hypothetical protein TorRG33x02_346770 [Trema orientale]